MSMRWKHVWEGVAAFLSFEGFYVDDHWEIALAMQNVAVQVAVAQNIVEMCFA